MYVTDELYAEFINRFNQLIGVLRWSIELGRIYIMTEVSFLSQRLCSPREGHLNAVYRILRYPQNKISKNTGKIAFYTNFAHTDEKVFEGIIIKLDGWKDFYPYAAEVHLSKKLEPLGISVTVWVYVDTKHAGKLANMRSHSGILIYVNNTLIKLYINRQNKVESPSFGL